MTPMPPAVHVALLPADSRLRWCSIDRSSVAAEFNGRELRIAGWVLGQDKRAVAVELSAGRDVLERFPVVLNRPDVEAAYPDAPNAGSSGFEGLVRFLTFPDSGLDLSVVLEDQERVAIGNIAVKREPAINGHDNPDALPPKVSVVIPCYRQAHFLTEAIASALRQSYSNLEIIVVDDGSPDNTEEVVRRFPGVRYIRQRNQGLAAARNAGVRASTGDFVIFLDADDRLVPGAATSGMLLFRQNPEYGLVAGQYRFIGLDGFVLSTPRPRSGRSDQYIEMVGDYFIGPPGVAIFRRAALDRVGLFDSSISPAADYDMSLRVAREFPICMHDELALEYRRHGANMSGDPAVMMATTMTALRRQWRFVRKTERGRRAYEAGVRHWRECWGEPLVQKVVADARARKLIDALNGFGTLLRYHRTGFFDAVRALRHRDGEAQS